MLSKKSATDYDTQWVTPSGGSLPARTSISVTTVSLAPGASANVTAALPRTCAVLTGSTDVPARVALYDTDAARTSDAGRFDTTPLSAPVGPDTPVAQFATAAGALSVRLGVLFANGDSPAAPGAYVRIYNTGSVASTVTLTLTYVQQEA